MKETDKNLFNEIKEAKSLEILFEQYKLYVELMDRVSARRHQTNSFFLTVNSVAVTLLAGILSLTKQSFHNVWWLVVASVCGIVFSITWRRLIHSYRQLNKGKFVIIHSLESKLPARLFDAEWEVLKHGDGSVYKPFSSMESVVPLVFLFMYVVLGIYAVVILFCQNAT